MSGLRLAYKQTLVCSFCGKAAGEVERLIAGPTVLICNECVALCQGILNEVDDEALGRAFTAAQEARVADIARGIVAAILQGTDARIRDAINASSRDPSAPIAGEEAVR